MGIPRDHAEGPTAYKPTKDQKDLGDESAPAPRVNMVWHAIKWPHKTEGLGGRRRVLKKKCAGDCAPLPGPCHTPKKEGALGATMSQFGMINQRLERAPLTSVTKDEAKKGPLGAAGVAGDGRAGGV